MVFNEYLLNALIQNYKKNLSSNYRDFSKTFLLLLPQGTI